MNKQGQGIGVNLRGQWLIDAVYQSLGYTSNASGSWKTPHDDRSHGAGRYDSAPSGGRRPRSITPGGFQAMATF
jgi:hypothetical protein